jgi:hypothetical protein
MPLVFQIMYYDNQIDSLIKVFSEFSEYHLDLVIFSVILHTKHEKEKKIDEESGFLCSWIVNLAKFTGKFCKAYHDSVDLSSVFDFVLE